MEARVMTCPALEYAKVRKLQPKDGALRTLPSLPRIFWQFSPTVTASLRHSQSPPGIFNSPPPPLGSLTLEGPADLSALGISLSHLVDPVPDLALFGAGG